MTKRAKMLTALCIAPETSIHDAIEIIERNGQGIALVIDGDRHLIGTITDGDIRRAVLQQLSLDTSVHVLMARARQTTHRGPIHARFRTPQAELLRLMNESTVRHIPLVDDQGRLVDIALLSELVKEYELPLTAVVMAGGYGKRIRPLTEHLPKPMLPVGDRPLLEHTIGQLQQAGIRRVMLTTHYKSDVINKHFGDGSKFGVDIQYIHEDDPLGTAGALGLLEDVEDPLLVINGDILTSVNFQAMLDFHKDHGADMTMAVRQHQFQVPYGIVEATHDGRVIGISEKPAIDHFVNAGMYLINPNMRSYIATDQRCDMPDVINRLLQEGLCVIAFPVREHWFDIGNHEDYARAQEHLDGHVVEPAP